MTRVIEDQGLMRSMPLLHLCQDSRLNQMTDRPHSTKHPGILAKRKFASYRNHALTAKYWHAPGAPVYVHVMSPSLSAGVEFAKESPFLSWLGQEASWPFTDTDSDAIATRAKRKGRGKTMIIVRQEDESEGCRTEKTGLVCRLLYGHH